MSDESAVMAAPLLLVEAENEYIEGEYELESVDEPGYPRYRKCFAGKQEKKKKLSTWYDILFSKCKRAAANNNTDADDAPGMFLWYGRGAWHFSHAIGEPPASEKFPSIRSSTRDPTTIRPSQLGVWEVFRIATLQTTDDDSDADDRTLFVDHEFPPNETSLNDPSIGKRKVDWIRVDKLRNPRPVLFRSTTDMVADPFAPLQGGLQDCWLIAALSSMAERKTCIQDHFVDGLTLPPDGKIRVRLYDYQKTTWNIVTVDTLIPCWKMKSGWYKPLYARLGASNPPECWPLILEKAYAKFVARNYNSLSMGYCQCAWQASTGVNRQWYYARGGVGVKDYTWVKYELDLEQQMKASSRFEAPFKKVEGVSFDESMMFRLMEKFDCNNGLMTCMKASNPNIAEYVTKTGLVRSHAYTVLSVLQFDDANGHGAVRLVKLRNPWGAKEWTGPWADGSAEWKAHPEIHTLLAPRFADDGVFYMSYEDWRIEFPYLCVSPAENSVLANAERVHPQPAWDSASMEKRLKRIQELDVENHSGSTHLGA